MLKYSLPDNIDENSNLGAYVGVDPEYDLSETAARLANALGVALAPTDRFDEYPAFAGEISGLSFALIGLPSEGLEICDEPTNSFELQVASIGSKRRRGPEIDISSHLANYLSETMSVKCWPLSR